ncbi:polyketide cyclase [Prescottella equi]|uniref:SRPBCC family protein n=1 Tax=Rhodococcus hoagii TaxID=43767 RepID=UPI000A0FF729|nr:SRPBCC family protein [Prescottella equi]ORL32131.1 polyketide cyclase [Prescottella equi]
MPNRFVISAQRVLAATLDEVWELTSDTGRYGDWVVSVREVTAHHGPATVGKSYRERVTSVGPLTSRAEWTVRTLEPKTLRIDSGVGLAPLRDVVNIFRFAPVGDAATSMTYEFHFTLGPAPLGALVHKILRSSMAAAFDESMRALETVILSERPAQQELREGNEVR